MIDNKFNVNNGVLPLETKLTSYDFNTTVKQENTKLGVDIDWTLLPKIPLKLDLDNKNERYDI